MKKQAINAKKHEFNQKIQAFEQRIEGYLATPDNLNNIALLNDAASEIKNIISFYLDTINKINNSVPAQEYFDKAMIVLFQQLANKALVRKGSLILERMLYLIGFWKKSPALTKELRKIINDYSNQFPDDLEVRYALALSLRNGIGIEANEIEAKKQITRIIDQDCIPVILNEAEKACNELHPEYALSILSPHIRNETINTFYKKVLQGMSYNSSLRYRFLQIELFEINRSPVNQDRFYQNIQQLLSSASHAKDQSYAEYLLGYSVHYGIFRGYYDIEKAQSHYRKAMTHYTPAKLAYYHLQIRKWPENYRQTAAEKAFKELLKISKQSAQAEFLIAHCYRAGIGTNKDEAQSNERLKSTAERGYKPAQLMWARTDKKNISWAKQAYTADTAIFDHESLYDNTLVDYQAQNRDFWQGLSNFRLLPSAKMKETEIEAELHSVKIELEKTHGNFSAELNKKLKKLCRNDSLDAMEILVEKYYQDIKAHEKSCYEKLILNICDSLSEITYFIADVKNPKQIIKIANILLESCLRRTHLRTYSMKMVNCACWILCEIKDITDNELMTRSEINLATAQLYNMHAEKNDDDGLVLLKKYANLGSQYAKEILKTYLNVKENSLQDISLLIIHDENNLPQELITAPDPSLNYRLAQHCLYGLGVKQDKKRFIHYYTQAKETNCSEADYLMAYAYANGIFFEKNSALAINLLKKILKDDYYYYIPATALLATLYLDSNDDINIQEAEKILRRADRTIINCVRANAFLNRRTSYTMLECIPLLLNGDHIDYAMEHYLLGVFNLSEYKKTKNSKQCDEAIQHLNDFLRYYDLSKDDYIFQVNQFVDEYSFFYPETTRISTVYYLLANRYYQRFEFVKAAHYLKKAIEYCNSNETNKYTKLITLKNKCEKIMAIQWKNQPELFNGKPIFEILLELYKTTNFESIENNKKLDALVDQFFEIENCELMKEQLAKLYKKKGNLAYAYELLLLTTNAEKLDKWVINNRNNQQLCQRVARKAVYDILPDNEIHDEINNLSKDFYMQAFKHYYGMLGPQDTIQAMNLLALSIEQENYIPAAIFYLIEVIENMISYQEDTVSKAMNLLRASNNLNPFGCFILYRACRLFPHLVNESNYEIYLNQAIAAQCKPALAYAAVLQNNEQYAKAAEEIIYLSSMKLIKTNENYDIEILKINYCENLASFHRDEQFDSENFTHPESIDINALFSSSNNFKIENYSLLNESGKKCLIREIMQHIKKNNFHLIPIIFECFFSSLHDSSSLEIEKTIEKATIDCLFIICETIEMGSLKYRNELLTFSKTYLKKYLDFIIDGKTSPGIMRLVINLIYQLKFIEKEPESEIYLAFLQLESIIYADINTAVSTLLKFAIQKNETVLTFLSRWYHKYEWYEHACIMRFLQDNYDTSLDGIGMDYLLAHAVIIQEVSEQNKLLFSKFFSKTDSALGKVLFLQYLAIEFGFVDGQNEKENILIKAAKAGYNPAKIMLSANYIHDRDTYCSITSQEIEDYLWESSMDSSMVHYLRYQYNKNINPNKQTYNSWKLACNSNNYFALVAADRQKPQSKNSEKIEEAKKKYTKENILQCLLTDLEDLDYLFAELLYGKNHFPKVLNEQASNEAFFKNSKVINSAENITINQKEIYNKYEQDYFSKKKLYFLTKEKLTKSREKLEKTKVEVGEIVTQCRKTNLKMLNEWSESFSAIDNTLGKINVIQYKKWPDFDEKTTLIDMQNLIAEITNAINEIIYLNKEIINLHNSIPAEKINNARKKFAKFKPKTTISLTGKLENITDAQTTIEKESETAAPVINTKKNEAHLQLSEKNQDNRHQYKITLELPAKEKANPEKAILEQAQTYDPLPEWREVLREFELLRIAASKVQNLRDDSNLLNQKKRKIIRRKLNALDKIINNLHSKLIAKELENKVIEFPARYLIENFVTTDCNDKVTLRKSIIDTIPKIEEFFNNLILQLSENETQAKQTKVAKKQLIAKKNTQTLLADNSFWGNPNSQSKYEMFKTILNDIIHKVEPLVKNTNFDLTANVDCLEGKLIFLQHYYHFLRLCCAFKMARNEKIQLFAKGELINVWVSLRNAIVHSGQEIIANRIKYATCFNRIIKEWKVILEQHIKTGKSIQANILNNPELEHMVTLHENSNPDEKTSLPLFVDYCITSLFELYNELKAAENKANNLPGKIGKETLTTVFLHNPGYVSAIKAIITLLGDVINDYDSTESWIMNFPCKREIIKARNEICHKNPNPEDIGDLTWLQWTEFDDVSPSDLINILNSLDKIKTHCEKELKNSTNTVAKNLSC